jgi:hypothetical protein
MQNAELATKYCYKKLNCKKIKSIKTGFCIKFSLNLSEISSCDLTVIGDSKWISIQKHICYQFSHRLVARESSNAIC